MIKFKNKKVIDCFDWDKLVQETYKRPYCFQQQDDCQDRGQVGLTIPYTSYDEEMNDSIPEIINGEKMGVKFKVWLERDPEAPLNPTDEQLALSNYYFKENRDKWCSSPSNINLFYERNFYPELQAVANDLHSKGLIEAGEYTIDIDW